MFIPFRESVLDYASADGTIAPKIIEQLLIDHGLLDTIDDVKSELGDEWDDAEVFLAWLGY